MFYMLSRRGGVALDGTRLSGYRLSRVSGYGMAPRAKGLAEGLNWNRQRWMVAMAKSMAGRGSGPLGNRQLDLTEDLVRAYSLDTWARGFSLMTAGYRDPLDPADADSPEVPFNTVTVAILAEAKARVFEGELSPGETGHVHLGGETRPHTQTFIQVAARVYAAHGFRVHLRQAAATTPIWYSSFGVFYEGYQSGDNFTASHSQYFKGGWKPMDGSGQQLLKEEAEITAAVKAIVARRETIRLAPLELNPLIAKDFEVDAAYVAFLRSVLGDDQIARVAQAGRDGFRAAICTMGGSMKATSERIFAALGITTGPDGMVSYFRSEEDSHYHGIGLVGGRDVGVDPSKPEVYRQLATQGGLQSGKADLVLLWDPDGDRLNIVTRAPLAVRQSALAAGLEVDNSPMGDECIVSFTPNQLYLMLAAFRIDLLAAAGKLRDCDWFVGLTYPTTKSLEELSASANLASVRVPVGFKYIGNLCKTVEDQLDGREVVFETSIGDRVRLGRKPRALMLCEESGGATLGGAGLLASRDGKHAMLALREKDAMQLGLLSLCLTATLYQAKGSFAQYYCDLVARKGLRFIHASRQDVLLYDESLRGPALEAAKQDGFRKRDRVMEFFGRLADEHKADRLSLPGVQQAINDHVPAGPTRFPPLKRACRLGDDPLLHGMLFEAENLRLVVRASGTDALLRYYVEGTDPEQVKSVRSMLKGLAVP